MCEINTFCITRWGLRHEKGWGICWYTRMGVAPTRYSTMTNLNSRPQEPTSTTPNAKSQTLHPTPWTLNPCTPTLKHHQPSYLTNSRFSDAELAVSASPGGLDTNTSLIWVQNQLLARIENWSNRKSWWFWDQAFYRRVTFLKLLISTFCEIKPGGVVAFRSTLARCVLFISSYPYR